MATYSCRRTGCGRWSPTPRTCRRCATRSTGCSGRRGTSSWSPTGTPATAPRCAGCRRPAEPRPGGGSDRRLAVGRRPGPIGEKRHREQHDRDRDQADTGPEEYGACRAERRAVDDADDFDDEKRQPDDGEDEADKGQRARGAGHGDNLSSSDLAAWVTSSVMDASSRRAVDALNRIAFLLERSREPSYRVKAFRNAATTVSLLPAGELDQRITESSLQELNGIGQVTAT